MSDIISIPFNKPSLCGKELEFIQQALSQPNLHGNGLFTKKCHQALEKKIGCSKALLTNSCTAALEMSAILADIQPGDEIIMPSYTFVSTANAFVLRGGIPVFVDIRADTFNIDETKILEAITPRTKAIVCVHYAGVSCEMDTILSLANDHGLIVIEDAAQGIESFYKGKPLGSMGHLSAISFHGTKNIISGEGGALFVKDRRFLERAEIIWEKGTNRKKFLLGEVDKYSWVDIGSSYLPSEITAAFLWAQLPFAKEITEKRLEVWRSYHQGLQTLEEKGKLRRPIVPSDCQHNAHLYAILLPDGTLRNHVLESLRNQGIQTSAHYVPMHDSSAGRTLAKTHGSLVITEQTADRVLRLPVYPSLTLGEVQQVVEALQQAIESFAP